MACAFPLDIFRDPKTKKWRPPYHEFFTKELTLQKKDFNMFCAFNGERPPPTIVNMWLPQKVTQGLNICETLHIPYYSVKQHLNQVPNVNRKYPIIDMEFTGSLLPRQIEVETEAWQQLQQYGSTTLGLYTGFGKTVLSAVLACRCKLLTVVLVHRDLLISQWCSTFENFTTAKDTIWVIGKNNPSHVDVIICMDTRTDQIPLEIREAVGCVIIDEAHAFCTPSHIKCLLTFRPKYVIAATATLKRDDAMHKMIELIVGTHGVWRKASKLFKVYKVETDIIPELQKVERYMSDRNGGVSRKSITDWHALSKSIYYDIERNEYICNLALNNLHRKILILTKEVGHSQYLVDVLKSKNITADDLCGTKSSYTDAQVLVGTVSKIGTGFDQESFCKTFDGKKFNMLILTCSIKKVNNLIQIAGRVFRSDDPVIYHLVDKSDLLERHWKGCQKWYKQAGGEIFIINRSGKEVKKKSKSVKNEDIMDMVIDMVREQNF